MLTVIIFIAVISILIFVHELGHFVVAKRAGMRVDEFGFGFPPLLWGFTKGETRYSINWIPFGGFVKIYGEDGDDRSQPRSFGSKSFSARMAVVLAGVVMNFIFASVLLGFGNIVGLRIGLISDAEIQSARDIKVQIISVAQNSPAETAGLKLLDEIKGFRSAEEPFIATTNPQEVKSIVDEHLGRSLTIIVARGGDIIEKEVSLRKNPPAGEGSLGISMALTGVVSYPWYVAIWKGFSDAAVLSYNTAYGFAIMFKNLVVNRSLGVDISGPIGIATLTGQAARIGFSYLVQFVAMISVNLAVLNAIPFPALDGGRAFMLIIEKLKGSPINKKFEAVINTAGFFLLIGLMLLITARDISRLF